MKIIILGAGQVGSSLAEHLSAGNNDITLVDTSFERLQAIQEKYDIRTVHGFASYPTTLLKAGADSADMLVAVTDNDEVNMIACQVVYSLYHTPMKIARIRSPQYFVRKDLYGADNLPIDVFISPEELVTKNISQLINYPESLQVLDFSNGKVKLIAIKPYYGGPLLGKSVGKMYEQFAGMDLRVVAIYRNDHAIPFDEQTLIEIGDELFFISDERYTQKIMSTLRRDSTPYKRVVIAGGGTLGLNIAKALQQTYQVKLIEPDKNRCQFLARTLQNVMVLNGKVSDKQLLINENIEHVDVFCAVTGDDELNIIAGLQAKHLGVRQVMALITQPSYIDLIEGGAINIAISPHLSTISAILTHLRRGDVVNVYSLHRGAAEAIEIIAHGDHDTSRVVGRRLGAIKLPANTRIGAIVRKEKEVLMPTPDLVIEAEDHVILFVANMEDIRDIEKLFQVSAEFF